MGYTKLAVLLGWILLVAAVCVLSGVFWLKLLPPKRDKRYNVEMLLATA